MSYTPPTKILVTTDDNILEFKKSVKTKTENMFIYEFVKSKSKLGMEVSFTEKDLINNLKNTFKII